MSEPLPRRIQRFEVLERLGEGGMGAVYRARDPELERDVAIKVLAGASAAPAVRALSPTDTIDLRGGGGPASASASAARDDLLREARIMAQLSHPNVLPVYEVGVAEGAVFLVMEHIAGCDLSRWLSEPRTTPQILDVFAQAARGLAAAHERGIVHRDVKPANVLVGDDGRARVADFGISRLTARAPGSMVHIDDGRGTPRYMAPELWRDAEATPRSDIYSLGSALDEALGGVPDEPPASRDRRWRERGLSDPQRAALAAALSEDPAQRPALSALLPTLLPAAADGSAHPRGRRVGAAALAGIAAVLAAIIVAGAIVVLGDDRDGRYADDLSTPSGVLCAAPQLALFTPAAADRLSTTLSARPGHEPARARINTARVDLSTQRRAACDAARAGALSLPQLRERLSCFDRIALESDAVLERLAAVPRTPALALELAQTIWDPAECAGISAPLLPADPSPTIALFRRWVAADELAVPDLAEAHERELAAIEAQALQLDERMLAARAAYSVGVEQHFQNELAEADATFQRVYRAALALGATGIAARSLVQRSLVTTLRGDPATAQSLAELARDLAERPTTAPRTRVRVLGALGRALHERGDAKAAAAVLARGLALAQELGDDPDTELGIRFSLIAARTAPTFNGPSAVPFALETLELVRRHEGEADPDYGVALNLVAMAHQAVHDRATALDYRRRALDAMKATMPADHSTVLWQRFDTAIALYESGELATARDEARLLLEHGAKNQAVRATRPAFLALQAFATFELGDFTAGVRLAEQVIEEGTAQHGPGHPDTLGWRGWLAAAQLELGRPAEAERQLDAIERACRADAKAHALDLARAEGLRARIATARGRAADGEQGARAALASLAELGGSDTDRLGLQRALGESLLAQRRWADARVPLEAALTLARRTQQRADELAALEILVAAVDAGLGRRAQARSAARAARDVLATYPGQLDARRRADAILAGR